MVRPVGLETRLAFPEKGAAGVVIKRARTPALPPATSSTVTASAPTPATTLAPQGTRFAHLM